MNRYELTKSDTAALAAIIPPERLLLGGDIGEDYAHDELGGVISMPGALVRVLSTEEVSAVMKLAYERGIPVVVRGSGTGLVGAAVALRGGIMLETTLMDDVIELDEDNLTLTVQPGMLLMDIAKYVEARGFFYPPDPGEKTATIGGNISTNAGGMRAVKYGVTRDFVRGLTVVLPTGEVIETGGKVVKNSTGYSIKDLIIGSEGTLGIITQAVLKLLPLPGCSISLLCPYEDMRAALLAVPRIIRSRHTPTAVEFMERDTILFAEDYLGKRFPTSDSPYYLLLTFDGAERAQVEAEYTAAAELCLETGAKDVYIVDTEERKDSVWTARGAFLEAIKASTTEMDECDVVVPRTRVAEFIEYTRGVAREVGVRIPGFGHAGDGNLHLYICRDDLSAAAWQHACAQAFDRLYAKAAELGGLVSGEHGVGFAKREYMARQLGREQIELMRRIKLAFDPKDILNPGKIV